jgi:hypothetical protein
MIERDSMKLFLQPTGQPLVRPKSILPQWEFHFIGYKWGYQGAHFFRANNFFEQSPEIMYRNTKKKGFQAVYFR